MKASLTLSLFLFHQAIEGFECLTLDLKVKEGIFPLLNFYRYAPL